MNNRRDRLSADMKGTVSLDDDTKSSQKEKIGGTKSEQNDGPDDRKENPSEFKIETDKKQTVYSQPNDAEVESNRPVTAGDQERLQLDWRVSQWSRCSRTCGKEGKKVKSL